MSSCVFCKDVGVATTATTTPVEAFPFLCAQVGVTNSSQGGGSPVPLCGQCHSLWEEVTLLYTNMQGLLNLMGRRVAVIKQRVKDHNTNYKMKTQTLESLRAKRSTINTPSAPSSESMLNWWYPAVDITTTNNRMEADLGQEDEVKMEPIGDSLDDNGEIEFEDVEILPDQTQGDDEEDDQDDPTYDPLANPDSPCDHASTSTPRQKQIFIPQDYPPVETLTSSQGKPMISVLGFAFNYKSTSIALSKTIWICKRSRQNNCKSRIHTTDDRVNPKFILEIGTHTHEPEGGAYCTSKKIRNKITEAALTTTKTPKEIITEYRKEYESIGTKANYDSLKKSIIRVRKAAAAKQKS